LRPPGRIVLHDISRDGQILMTTTLARRSVAGFGPGQPKERDLSFLDWTRNVSLSADGTQMLFEEQGEGGGPNYSVFVRNLDGSPPIRLGEGIAFSFSPDGKSVLTANVSSPPQIFAVPLGAGEPRQLTRDNINHAYGAFWVADGKQIVFDGFEPGHALRAYRMDASGGPPQPIAPEGVAAYGVSPDGKTVLLYDTQGKLFLASLSGGETKRVADSGDLDRFAGWSSEGHYVYMYRARDIPARIFKLDLLSGARKPLVQFMPSDPAGLINVGPIQITPDGQHYAYGFVRVLSDLYVVDDLN
jgi:eukaryotic-like serine/threonine-protein kinase